MKKPWLLYAIAVTLMWGLWGALTAMLSNGDIPSTIIYAIWAFTMIIPCIVALKLVNWKLETDKRSIILGCTIGFLGSGGQMLLFYAVDTGPAYLIFPIVSLSPLITIVLSFLLLKERTGKLGTAGIIIALITLPLFEYSEGNSTNVHGLMWFILALSVMTAWGLQAYFMKFSNNHMSAESIFFYMTATALLLIPVAYLMTDAQSLNQFDFSTIPSIAGVQILNSIGALCLVYAFRYGKAMVVSPLTNAGAPLISSVLSIILLGIIPGDFKILGIALAVIAAILLAIEPEETKQSS
ncbi:DMT family transporter [Shewanella frigidimarina]|uniref:EamA-like transporter family protein n=1 Tax=Shewanella frigidimarina TaxID=56812 RepID=A0A106BXU6_SHEFR|nr:DMT family transporter [Shewanella frigidimarina]KVX00599.1 EamA-like transporter family protein [Shewanella frigidimarina]